MKTKSKQNQNHRKKSGIGDNNLSKSFPSNVSQVTMRGGDDVAYMIFILLYHNYFKTNRGLYFGFIFFIWL